MTYFTMTVVHDALTNELNTCQAQLIAVRKKLKENWKIIYAHRNDPCSNVLRNAEIQNLEEKCDTLIKIEAELINKESRLTNAITDFDENNW